MHTVESEVLNFTIEYSIPASWRNQNRIWKHFSLLIRGLYEFESGKKYRLKVS